MSDFGDERSRRSRDDRVLREFREIIQGSEETSEDVTWASQKARAAADEIGRNSGDKPQAASLPSAVIHGATHLGTDDPRLIEARADTKFAELRGDLNTRLAEIAGEIKASSAKLDTAVSYTAGLKATVVATGIGSALAIAALIAAMLPYGGQLFGVGMDLSTVADEAASRAVEQAMPRQRLGTIDTTSAAPSSPETGE